MSSNLTVGSRVMIYPSANEVTRSLANAVTFVRWALGIITLFRGFHPGIGAAEVAVGSLNLTLFLIPK